MPNLNEWNEFLVGLKDNGVEFALSIALGEKVGTVTVTEPAVPPTDPTTPPVDPTQPAPDKDWWTVDTTGKNNTRVKVRPSPTNASEVDYVNNGDLLEGPAGKRENNFVYIERRVSPATHLVAGWVEIEWLKFGDQRY